MMNKIKGRLYLIPVTLGPLETSKKVLPDYNFNVIYKLKYFVVEQVRTARRFLSSIGYPHSIEEIIFMELNKHTDKNIINSYLNIIDSGESVGLLSEAGTPCIADPGNVIVKLAHQKDIEIEPLVGPNSIILALMGSGFNGQNFAFKGYLPIDKSQLVKKIKELESKVYRNDQTQIFIETPYRNNKLIETLISSCSVSTALCVATNLTLDNQQIITKSISEWKKTKIDIHKKPTVFLLYK